MKKRSDVGAWAALTELRIRGFHYRHRETIPMTRRHPPRRGILLLIVLSLLVLFVLIGLTFVVVATQYSRAARVSAQAELTGDAPAKELDSALYLILRGSQDPLNLTHRHNLLSDVYGHDDHFVGSIANPIQPQAAGALIQIPFKLVDGFPRTDNYYAGCVLTLLDGNGRGHSTRIVRYAPSVDGGSLFIAGFEDAGPTVMRPGDRFLVNGKAFNGTGDGYDPNSGRLSGALDRNNNWITNNFPTDNPALMPNLREAEYPGSMIGGSDESWDAADYQNYFLARIPSKIRPNPLNPPLDPNGQMTNANQFLRDPLIPSFHRPFLVNYWMQELPDGEWDALNPTSNHFRRFVISRPMWPDHPLFTGSNPAFADPRSFRMDAMGNGNVDPNGDGFIDRPITRGPWDVDNDNDGIADSIWVDLGIPAKTSPDGRMYKPLFAVLCVDLDGRLNVNAHDNNESERLISTPLQDAQGFAAGGAGPLTGITRGSGYGPAEIRLSNPELRIPNVQMLLASRSEDATRTTRTPGYPDNNATQGIDWENKLREWNMPANYVTQSDTNGYGSAYHSPSDLRGIGGVYLDLAGQPRFALMGKDFQDRMGPIETVDDPYESNLVSPNAGDNLFSVSDQEQLLRAFDVDTASISNEYSPTLNGNRLRSILLGSYYVPGATNLNGIDTRSRRFTTHSFDVPSPNIQPPSPEFRQLVHQYQSNANLPIGRATVSDMVRALLLAKGFAGTPQDLEKQVHLMVPTELRKGQRMDINRWLGNARDDNSNGVIDEPTETEGLVWTGTPFESATAFAMDDPHYVDASNVFFSRQQYARHLYCLMMLLNTRINDAGIQNPGFTFPSPVYNEPEARRRKLTALRIAQWAINVVDFRDPDSIMTPFEFDLEPFDANGWSVDDDIRTSNDNSTDSVPDRAVVWGCETPELIITETAAFHDRRVKDTNQEKPVEGQVARKRLPEDAELDDPNNEINAEDLDEDLDQFRVPQGSLFLELYCTRNKPSNNNVVPNELYQSVNGSSFLDLEKMAPGNTPVWRIAIARRPPAGSDPDTRSDTALLLPALPGLTLGIDQNPPDLNIFDPNDMGLMRGLSSGITNKDSIGNGVPQVNYERFIYFTHRNPNAEPNFYNRNPPNQKALLRPGHYAVIGPRETTHFGSSRNNTNPDGTPAPSPQKIELYAPTIELQTRGIFSPPVAGGRTGIANTKRILAIVAQADPFGWVDPIGVSVSEPLPGPTYYHMSTDGTVDPEKLPTHDGHDGGHDRSFYKTGMLPDVPLDEISMPGRPLSDPEDRLTGTHRMFRVAVLERLADPTAPFNQRTNPYIPVDSQAIDLNVFNGEEESEEETRWEELVQKVQGDIDDENFRFDPPNNPLADDPVGIYFESRERGNAFETQTLKAAVLLNPISTSPGAEPNAPRGAPPEDGDAPAPAGDGSLYWNYEFKSSFGYLNSTYGSVPLPERPKYGDPITATTRLSSPLPYVGDPAIHKSPWLVWNDRPYVSQLELMQVPSGSPWRLLYEFRGRNINNNDGDPYGTGNGIYQAEYSHLLNFFQNAAAAPNQPANFNQLFDYLEVPSRFAGTQQWLNPQQTISSTTPQMRSFLPPFNRVSRFREPGRVNLNTIPDREVWTGIDPTLGPTRASSWNRIQTSLKGNEPNQNISDRPAFYGNPLRSAASADLMPTRDLEKNSSEATLLRSLDGNEEQLFGFESGVAQPIQASQHNSYFRYHRLQRLGNLLTSHSNVYAVWITVGYFEVHPWNPNDPTNLSLPPIRDPAHPDGYQLGLELGSDTGETKRHRAFYMIDRSLPVGFQPGENHNVDRAVLLRRMLE